VSQQNVQIMRATYDAWNRGDLDAVLKVMHPNLVWEEDAQASGVGLDPLYIGHAGYLKRQRDAFSIWEQITAQNLEYTDAGEHVGVSVRARARAAHSGIEVEMHLVEVFTLDEGKIVRRRVYADRSAALRALGLRQIDDV
jgi:ketosteroid isomerase-like protein